MARPIFGAPATGLASSPAMSGCRRTIAGPRPAVSSSPATGTSKSADAVATLRQAFVDAGRDPGTLDICDGLRSVDGSLERSMAEIPAMAEAGINVIRVHLRRFSPGPDEVLSVVEEATRRFEEFRALRA